MNRIKWFLTKLRYRCHGLGLSGAPFKRLHGAALAKGAVVHVGAKREVPYRIPWRAREPQPMAPVTKLGEEPFDPVHGGTSLSSRARRPRMRNWAPANIRLRVNMTAKEAISAITAAAMGNSDAGATRALK